MNVVMLSPGYPAEMAYFTRALAGVGARVIGVGDQPPHALPDAARESLAHYEHVNLADEGAVLEALRGLSRHASVDQVECLWEPYMLLAARIREMFGLPGLSVEQTVPFRDKETMKRALDAGGQILFEHGLWYRPRPLQMRMHEWISPVSISLRDLSVPHLAGGRRMGEAVLAALGFRSGFTHMGGY